ncbi:MAG: hypothetical protein Kow00120_10930 [Anaerolineae bacterium]
MSTKVSPWLRALPTLALALILALLVRGAIAQESAAEIELVGIIEAIGPTTITVNGQEINITDAEVDVALGAGLAVKVEGTLVGGEIKAREVSALQTGLMPGEIEIVGVLEGIEGQFVIVSGLRVSVAGAEVQSGLAVGAPVKVHATFLAQTGAWLAREVEAFTFEDDLADDNSNGNDNDDDRDDDRFDNEFRIVGTLEEIGEDYVIVSGLTIDVARAEIEGTLVIGALVKVEVSLVDGSLRASEVDHVMLRDLDRDDDDDDGNANDNDDDDDYVGGNANTNDNDDDDDVGGNANTNDNDDDDDHVSGNFNDNDDDDDHDDDDHDDDDRDDDDD